MENDLFEGVLKKELKLREEAVVGGLCSDYQQYAVTVAEIKLLSDMLQWIQDIKSGIEGEEE